MIIWRNFRMTPATCQGAVVVLGNFDGIHRGHQALLERAVSIAKHHHMPMVVVSFHPSPYRVFNPQQPHVQLLPIYDRLYQLQQLGVDGVLLQRFSTSFAAMSASEFIETVLIKALAAKHIVVGEDFSFGYRRQGNVSMIEQAGLVVTKLACLGDMPEQKFSSSTIRQLLSEAKLEETTHILGHPYGFSGRVVRGKQLGRQLGFPTANLVVHCGQMLPYGVYASQVKIPELDTYLPAVANYGIRPTVEGTHPQWDIHILHSNIPTLYGKRICLQLDRFIRKEQRFEDLDALRQAIANDIINVTRSNR